MTGTQENPIANKGPGSIGPEAQKAIIHIIKSKPKQFFVMVTRGQLLNRIDKMNDNREKDSNLPFTISSDGNEGAGCLLIWDCPITGGKRMNKNLYIGTNRLAALRYCMEEMTNIYRGLDLLDLTYEEIRHKEK